MEYIQYNICIFGSDILDSYKNKWMEKQSVVCVGLIKANNIEEVKIKRCPLYKFPAL